MAQITAAVCREFGAPLQVERLDLRAPDRAEVEVEVAACAICHSDITYADGAWGGTLPAIYGHEVSGKISAIGEDVEGFEVGERVIVTLIRACGNCSACATGHPAACSRPPTGHDALHDADGKPVGAAMYVGGFAERVNVRPSQIAKLPDGIPLDIACVLSCGVITGVGAVVNTGQLRAGQDVVVIGAGGVGLNAIQGAVIAGARRVTAVDLLEDKLEIAKSFGATDTLLATDPNPAKALEAATGRLADLAIVTVGAVPAFESAPDFLAPGGKAIFVGMPHSGAKAVYEPVNITSFAQGFQGSKMGDAVLSRDIPWLADLYLQGRLELDALVSRRWPLEDINAAIADTRSGGAKRNVIVFS